MHALDQVFFHILHAGRQIDRDQPGPLARLDGPEIGSKPSASAPLRVALSSSREAGTAGRQVAQRRQLGEQVQVGALARLSVPMATRAPDA